MTQSRLPVIVSPDPLTRTMKARRAIAQALVEGMMIAVREHRSVRQVVPLPALL